jgi:AcrR family transcriptional regulator
MLVKMGRPREHDETTAGALLAAAEAVVESDGIEALSVRRVAEDVGTTTRAVYSLFGSKQGLLAAVGTRAFELLSASIDELPMTDDPAADLVATGATAFRNFAVGHPAIFRIALQRAMGSQKLTGAIRPARIEALRGLQARVERAAQAGLLDGRPARDVVLQFHALCEGLAALELRGIIPPRDAKRIWREALTALVAGLGAPPVG